MELVEEFGTGVSNLSGYQMRNTPPAGCSLTPFFTSLPSGTCEKCKLLMPIPGSLNGRPRNLSFEAKDTALLVKGLPRKHKDSSSNSRIHEKE